MYVIVNNNIHFIIMYSRNIKNYRYHKLGLEQIKIGLAMVIFFFIFGILIQLSQESVSEGVKGISISIYDADQYP